MACLRAWSAYVLACLHVCVLTCLACLRACVLTYLACLRGCVLTWLRAHVFGVLTCLRAYVFGVFTCLRAWRAYVLAWLRAWCVCVCKCVFVCLICFAFQYLNLKILTAKKLCALLSWTYFLFTFWYQLKQYQFFTIYIFAYYINFCWTHCFCLIYCQSSYWLLLLLDNIPW